MHVACECNRLPPQVVRDHDAVKQEQHERRLDMYNMLRRPAFSVNATIVARGAYNGFAESLGGH